MGAQSIGPIHPSDLIQVVITAAQTGAEVCFFAFTHLCLSMIHTSMDYLLELDLDNFGVGN